jgi:glutathione S-transferase
MTASTRPPIRLYRHPLSGHAHRAELMLSLLGLPCELVDVDLFTAAHKAPEYLARNPFGQLPLIEDGDFTLADSNAILVFLALQYDADRRWLPTDPRTQARVQRWLGVAAGQLAAGPAAARAANLFQRPCPPQAHAVAAQLLGIMERQLSTQDWLAAAHATIADVALYSYTAHAPEGGIGLGGHPAVRAWLERVEALPGFVGMRRSPVPEAA